MAVTSSADWEMYAIRKASMKHVAEHLAEAQTLKIATIVMAVAARAASLSGNCLKRMPSPVVGAAHTPLILNSPLSSLYAKFIYQ